MFELSDAIALLEGKGFGREAIESAIKVKFPDGKIDAEGLEELETLLTECGAQYQSNALPPSQEKASALVASISSSLSVRSAGQQNLIRAVIESEIATAIALNDIRGKVRQGINEHLQSRVYADAIAVEEKQAEQIRAIASGDGINKILAGYGIETKQIARSEDNRDFLKAYLAQVEEEPADVDFVQAYLDDIGV
jgi:hypothetical protein